jgi:hypothetical protein
VTVDERDVLAEQFEANRAHLRAVAYRMLGSQSEADDAVQESWLRLDRSDTGEVVRGAAAVAGTFSGRARFAQPALVDGAAGAVWAPGGRPRVVFGFTITGGKIVAIDLIADPERLRRLDLTIVDG